MSHIVLKYSSNANHTLDFIISGSKSISQRALIINSLIDFNGKLINLSNSEDTKILNHCLSSSDSDFNVYNSGTSLTTAPKRSPPADPPMPIITIFLYLENFLTIAAEKSNS